MTELNSKNNGLICPLCCRYGGFDGTHCSYCNQSTRQLFTAKQVEDTMQPPVASYFSQKKIDPNESIKKLVDYFTNPQGLWSPKELISHPKKLPNKKGVYGWYFDGLPPYVPENEYIEVDVWNLLYIGIAGATIKSKSNLRQRILSQHLKGNAYGSTLRRTLGSLLKEELGIQPIRRGKDFWFGKKGEKILGKWMASNARVAWIEHEYPKVVERATLRKYGSFLPLNVKENQLRNPFASKLSSIIATCRREAQ